jgi:ribonucleoside-diphosphate reductase alpha chain
MKLSENAEYLLRERYLLKNKNGDVCETSSQLFHRVAKAIAEVELKYGKSPEYVKNLKSDFYKIMSNLDALPNSPTLFNAGTELSQLSACFGIPIDDSLDNIFETLRKSAIIFKTGGGVGYNFSHIRPKNDCVKSTQGVSSGPLSFMNVYNEMCETVKQGSKRRGAMMGILNVNHPDILDFIVCKEKEGRLSNFNLSIGLDKDFMKALENNDEFNLINPRTKKPMQKIRARAIWNTLITLSWKNGEPAVLFFDTINKHNPTPEVGRLELTNPCSELPLLSYESCNLMSINISKFVKKNGKSYIDFDRLRKTIRLCVRFLDNVIDANKFPFEEIKNITLANRKIGLGLMGWADTLVLMKTPYDSEDAIALAKQVMKFVSEEGLQMSRELGKEKGNFPNKSKSIYKNEEYMRNATITTIAPTGSLSLIAGCSQSIEPLYSIVVRRNLEESLGKNIIEINGAVKSILQEKGIWNDNIIKTIESGQCLRLPHDMKPYIKNAHEITPEWHVRMQAAFQEFVHNSVSKTVNLPNEATIDDVENVYLLAYKLGCKGITVYRDGSRYKQLLNTVKCVECLPPPEAVEGNK